MPVRTCLYQNNYLYHPVNIFAKKWATQRWANHYCNHGLPVTLSVGKRIGMFAITQHWCDSGLDTSSMALHWVTQVTSINDHHRPMGGPSARPLPAWRRVCPLARLWVKISPWTNPSTPTVPKPTSPPRLSHRWRCAGFMQWRSAGLIKKWT